MTSDAKIGLLLGLIFIFVIAFVINGLPSLRPPMSKVGATTAPVTEDDFMGIAGTEKVANLPEVLGQQKAGSDTAQAAAGELRPAVQEQKPVAQETPQTPPAQTAGNEGVRYSSPLIEKMLEQLTPVIQPKAPVAGDVDLGTAAPAAEPPAPSGRSPVAAASPARTEVMPEQPRPVETLNKVVDTREPAKPAVAVGKPALIPGSKVYTVVEGDNLPLIAKKMYGAEEGNRVANVQRIFHANEAVLKSPDKVFVGQKLMIPPPLPKLSAATSASATPADVLPATYFERPRTISEKVKSLAERAPAAIPAPDPNARWYTVQNGDNLWKIAASQLGSGSRCDEIAKLNADILKSRDSLDVGMKLRLPAK